MTYSFAFKNGRISFVTEDGRSVSLSKNARAAIRKRYPEYINDNGILDYQALANRRMSADAKEADCFFLECRRALRHTAQQKRRDINRTTNAQVSAIGQEILRVLADGANRSVVDVADVMGHVHPVDFVRAFSGLARRQLIQVRGETCQALLGCAFDAANEATRKKANPVKLFLRQLNTRAGREVMQPSGRLKVATAPVYLGEAVLSANAL